MSVLSLSYCKQYFWVKIYTLRLRNCYLAADGLVEHRIGLVLEQHDAGMCGVLKQSIMKKDFRAKSCYSVVCEEELAHGCNRRFDRDSFRKSTTVRPDHCLLDSWQSYLKLITRNKILFRARTPDFFNIIVQGSIFCIAITCSLHLTKNEDHCLVVAKVLEYRDQSNAFTVTIAKLM